MANTPISVNDYFSTVGKIIINASLTEVHLLGAFQILSRCEVQMAKVIFYSIDPFQGKKTLLNRLVDAVGDAQDKKLVRDILEACKKSNDQRQQVSHAILAYYDEPGISGLHLVRPKSNSKIDVTKEYMSQLMKNSGEAYSASHKALEALFEKHSVPPKPNLQ